MAFACFKKSLWVELGGFDEKLLTNEDYDFNYRVRARGERVMLDRSGALRLLCARYAREARFAISSLRCLEGANGSSNDPRSLKLRQLVAPRICRLDCVAGIARVLAQVFVAVAGL